MALHYITGDPVVVNGVRVKSKTGEQLYDTSFEGLAAIYGVTPQQIAAANGFAWNAASIYAWLKTHGGIETTKGVFSFASGMAVEIPVDESKIVSHVPTDRPVEPVGPKTTTPGGTGSSITPTQAGGDMTMLYLVGAALILLLLAKAKGGKKGRGRGRKTTKRRSSRRRLYR